MAITPVVGTDPVSPLENLFNTQGAALQAQLNFLNTADLDSLNAITATAGLTYVVLEGGALFVGNGTVFVQATKATFASTTARDTAYAKASGAYKVARAEAVDTSTGLTWEYDGTAWQPGFATPLQGVLGLTGTFSATSGYTPKLEKNGNIVTLAFAITNSATTPTGTINTGTAIATLPAGFIPTANPVTPFTGMNNSGSVLISYTIDTSGVIRAYPLSALGGTATLYGSVSFSVA